MKNTITVIHRTQLRDEFNRDGALIGLLLIGSKWLLVASESNADLDEGTGFATVDVSNACTGVDRLRSTSKALDGANRAGILLHFSELLDLADAQLSRTLTF